MQRHTRLRLRRYRAGDGAACFDLMYRSVHGATARVYSDDERRAWMPDATMPSDWPMRRLDGQFAWLAWSGATLAGFMTAGADGYVDLAFTGPGHQRQGVASLLYERIEDDLRRVGCVWATTEASLLGRPFFAARGWSCDARQSVIRNGVALTSFRMSKSLAPAIAAPPGNHRD